MSDRGYCRRRFGQSVALCLAVMVGSLTVSGAQYEAQASPELAFSVYVRVLRDRVKEPGLGVYSPATQEWMRARRVTDGQQRAELAEIEAAYATRAIRDNGSLAVVTFPGSTRVPPYFLRRSGAGWTMDLAATARIIGFDRNNRWYVRQKDNEFAFAF
jgi:hypothetical protein